jgi:glycosyltransferase involved in cell wall biosynthesis
MTSVLVDALPLRHGGGVTYLKAQLAALADVAPELSVETLVSPWTDVRELPGTMRTVRLRSVAQRYAYELARLPLRRADVLYCPANFGPVVARAPIVVTVHNPNYYGAGLRLAAAAPSRPRRKVWANYAALRSAAAVVAISQSIADEVRETLPAVASKLHVIPSGAPVWDEPERPLPGLPPRYFLVIASAAPHKRVQTAVRGWADAARRSSSLPELVVVGEIAPAERAACVAAAGEHADRLHLLGRVSDRGQLRTAYARATAMVSMSQLEAFPLTPAEAGSLGCPLILSDIPPHREVTQGNAVVVGPEAVGELADALVAAASWQPGSRPWHWPVTWQDNARALRDLFRSVAP